MALYNSYGSSSKAQPTPHGKTEFELLKDTHKFLRDEDDDENNLSWEEKLASKYYSSLYREFAVCDLKALQVRKRTSFALRWRTEDEVLSGTGEFMCGNTRCKHHRTSTKVEHGSEEKKPSLTTLELPFAYVEHGESKSALVKVVLCEKCFSKLMWKRRHDKESKSEPESRPEFEPVAIKQEESELDALDDGEIGNLHRKPSRSLRAESTRSRSARIDRWDRERDIDREKPIAKRRSRSRSPRSQHRSKRRPHDAQSSVIRVV
ncbi:hypothetical protein BT96DRAFT_955380 [Gymnopus androsaceus JB14]|uniref:Folate-sensitive fragile site protein Fra10Ac1 n=1 Tax=Gymnopus androsaceus JB14 TaxID=1447944 RepID=A0A6A4I362_9AGAR|nr:hypothetical protein BT96DRAFT_955380 [Gymnopus androsaceus JB14]